jgi:hypothetical protein
MCCCCVSMRHWVLRWLYHSLPRGILVGPTCQVSLVVGPTQLRWTDRRVPRGTSWLRWTNGRLPCGTDIVAGFLSWRPFLSPYCTQIGSVPKLYLEKLVIKSQTLINPFNLLYLLWICFNSSTYSKIMKFLSKIPKFMVITPIIFNSTFALVSLC